MTGIGFWLRVARERAELTLAEMALLTHYSDTSLSAFELDQRPVPVAVVKLYARICDAPELINRYRAVCCELCACGREAA